MKRATILFFAIITAISGFCQTYILDGDRCFDAGDYDCAIANFNKAFKDATGKDKQIADIKLTRAKWCAEHIKIADQAFAAKNYSLAKEEYKKVLDSNPKDSQAQSQILKCDNALSPPKLRKATTTDLTDIWNNKYGVMPQRRQNLIEAGIDPIDAQARINQGEGKPQEQVKEKDKQTNSLSVSISILYFASHGGTSEQIKVFSDASTYSIPSDYIPSWCKVKTYGGYFTVTASVNPNYTGRKDWFKVTAGPREVRIYVEQSARPNPNSHQSSIPEKQSSQSNTKKCFNCPKTHDTWGFTFGYTQQTIDYNSMDGIQFGLKAEPLFKYGFAINTGIKLMGYSKNISKSKLLKNGFDAYGVNIPLHLEYRLNFSKWFNIFAYGGFGFNAIITPYSLPATFEYGGGFRISRIQFNVGSSLYLGNLKHTQNFGKNTETYQKLILSASYMF